MLKRLILISFGILYASSAWAQNPAQSIRTESELVTAEQLAMSDTSRKKLQKKLEHAVVTVYAWQPAVHELAESGVGFDGAAVAVLPEAVAEVLPKDVVQEETEPEPPKRNRSSFFDRGLDKLSSPFAQREARQTKHQSGRQYYLTTADWLTNSTVFEIEAFGKRLKARMEYRDDAQNVAILSTAFSEKLEPVNILDPEETLPSLVFVLLNPNTIYESFTQHVLHVPHMHLYGTATLKARNGYPVFGVQGELAGLMVGPDKSNSKGWVVHSGLLDRALHPQKYSRVKVEEIKLETYDSPK